MSKSIIPISELREGAILPAAIYDAQNSQLLLLSSGIKLTPEKIAGLQKRGVSRIAIDSKHVSAIHNTSGSSTASGSHTAAGNRRKRSPRENQVLNELRSKKTPSIGALSNALKKPTTPLYDSYLESSFVSANREHAQDLENFLTDLQTESFSNLRYDPLTKIARESVNLLLGDIDLFVKLAIESEQTKETKGYCLKVAQLAMSVATILEYSKDDVCQVGMGCMMSRIGISEDIQQIINAPRKLTPLESLEMKKNASKKLRLLEQIPGIPARVQQVAWQIHERWNGSGYPRGRSAQQIPPLVRIASVADAYVALTSDRPHRQAMGPYEAVETILEETKKGLFEPNAVRGLLRTISLFPLGSYIELSNKMYAVTVRNHSQQYDRPIVKVICDSFGLPAQKEVIILSEQKDLHVIRILKSIEVEDLLNRRKQHNKVLDANKDWSEQIAIS